MVVSTFVAVAWGGARLKSGALELHILKSLKRVPGQSFEDIFPRYP